ncbi:MAG: putative Tic20 family protein [Flavobacteriales bacterium]|jgi:uncharacterized Tic20 family protein
MDSLDHIDELEQSTQDERNIALLAHVGTFFGGFIVPLVIWLVKKDESKYISDHAKESLNFQISLIIYFVGSVLVLLLSFFLLGFFLLFFVVLGISTLSLVTTIIASINASQGKFFKYPLTIRFIK